MPLLGIHSRWMALKVSGGASTHTPSQEGTALLQEQVATITVPICLGPGLHPLPMTAQADGFADLSPVPKSSTLLLVGTMAAGLGLDRWKRRRRRQLWREAPGLPDAEPDLLCSAPRTFES